MPEKQGSRCRYCRQQVDWKLHYDRDGSCPKRPREGPRAIDDSRLLEGMRPHRRSKKYMPSGETK